MGYSPWGRKESDTAERLSTVQHKVLKALIGTSSARSASYRFPRMRSQLLTPILSLDKLA